MSDVASDQSIEEQTYSPKHRLAHSREPIYVPLDPSIMMKHSIGLYISDGEGRDKFIVVLYVQHNTGPLWERDWPSRRPFCFPLSVYISPSIFTDRN